MDEQPSLARSIRGLGLALVAVIVIGVGAGYLFAKSDPQRAARALISGRVVSELAADEAEPADPEALTWGESSESPACGVRAQKASPGQQLAVLRAGGVVVQYRPDDLEETLDDLVEVVRDRAVLLAPNPDIASEIAATAWQRRIRLEPDELESLSAFIVGYVGFGPDPGECPRR